MKKLMLGLLIGAVGMYFYDHRAQPPRAAAGSPAPQVETYAAPVETVADRSEPSPDRFRCDGRQHCSQMSSCEEATYFLQHCPNVKMDGDSDGIPCEDRLCGH
jgi:hypothetical protein